MRKRMNLDYYRATPAPSVFLVHSPPVVVVHRNWLLWGAALAGTIIVCAAVAALVVLA